MIEIILSSFNQLFNAIDIFLNSRDLTLGAILAGLAPFIVIYIKISKEKEKKIQRKLVERRQMQIAFNINEIMEALKVESKWSIEEIGSTHTVLPSLKKRFLSLQAVTILRRVKMKQYLLKLTSRRFLLAILAVIIPVINQEFGIDLNTATIIAIIGGLASFIIGESHVDAKKIASGPDDQNYSH